jgi:hypothetical protein
VHHAGEAGDAVATSKAVGGAEAARWIGVGLVERAGGCIVLVIVVVVQDDPSRSQIVRERGETSHARGIEMRELEGTVGFGEYHLTKTGELEVLAHDQLVHEGDHHPLDTFEGGFGSGAAGRRQVDRGGRWRRVPAGVDGDAAPGDVDLAHAEEFHCVARDRDPIADRHGGAVAPAEHEDPLGGLGIGVGVRVLLLDEESVQSVVTLEEGGNDRLDDHRARDRHRWTATLNLVDEAKYSRLRDGTRGHDRDENDGASQWQYEAEERASEELEHQVIPSNHSMRRQEPRIEVLRRSSAILALSRPEDPSLPFSQAPGSSCIVPGPSQVCDHTRDLAA